MAWASSDEEQRRDREGDPYYERASRVTDDGRECCCGGVCSNVGQIRIVERCEATLPEGTVRCELSKGHFGSHLAEFEPKCVIAWRS